MNAAGIIFTDSFDAKLDELTEKRTLASIPFGGRYRLVDFPLSNMVNAGIKNIGIITKKNYQSLMWHVRSGSDWDLDRKYGGLVILPPFSRDQDNHDIYENRLEGLLANMSYLRGLKEKYVILMSCGNIGNLDLNAFYEAHVKSGARLTVMYTKAPKCNQKGIDATLIRIDENGKLEEVEVADETKDGMYISMNAYIFNREDLLDLLEEAVRDGKKSLRRDIVKGIVSEGQAMSYETKDNVLFIDNLPGYLESSLSLLNGEIRRGLFHNDNGPIITPARDSAPTRYGKNAKVSNSMIADGAIIEGTVRNSVIFRGVRIEEGAVVENSVVMQNSLISANARINYAVIDKFALIDEERLLSGYITHPFYCASRTRI